MAENAGMLNVLRRFVLSNPMWISVACVVLCSVAASVGAMFILGLVVNLSPGWMFGDALLLAIAVPTLVSLPVSLIIISLLHEADDARKVAQKLAWRDDLTGALNRRRFSEMLRREFLGAERSGRPLTVALLDLDDFKAINDCHGHAAGDAVLRAVAEVIQSALRGTDLAARWGGEEFSIALPGADIAQAVTVTQRVRAAIGALRVATDTGESVGCTASIGIAERGSPNETLDELFNRADRAMYKAKHSGKNRVVVADAL